MAAVDMFLFTVANRDRFSSTGGWGGLVSTAPARLPIRFLKIKANTPKKFCWNP